MTKILPLVAFLKNKLSENQLELYLKDQWFCSEKEAKEAGFALGANCD